MTRGSDEDRRWMARALALARRGEGLTRPNPPVGAVLVRGGEAVGEGWHRKAGGPHAEVYALRQAGERARGATLYVTLEPCTTTGRTPPCADAVLRAGVARVVMAVKDPNPKHAGRAVPTFRRAGVEVACGVCAEEAAELLAPFATTMLMGRPHFTLKLGMTLDGRLADARGRSKWITGEAAREKVQALRRAADAVMVGAGTVRADKPSLWPRPDGGREPWRVVVGGAGGLPLDAPLFCDDRRERTLVAYAGAAGPDAEALKARGVGVVTLPKRGYWKALCKELRARDVMGVLCEGGGGVAGELLRAGLADRLQLFTAPKWLGAGGVAAAGGASWRLADAPEFVFKRAELVGGDVWTTLERRAEGAE